MLHCWWNVSELRPYSQQPAPVLLTDHVQMALVCLEAPVIMYMLSHFMCSNVLFKCMYSMCVCLCRGIGEQQGFGLAQNRVVINLTQ